MPKLIQNVCFECRKIFKKPYVDYWYEASINQFYDCPDCGQKVYNMDENFRAPAKDKFVINEIDSVKRVVSVELNKLAIQLKVPSLFGEIFDVELKENFILVHTFEGRVSFHSDGDLKGLLHWHSIRKSLRGKCLLKSLAKRVDVHITHYHWGKGAKSKVGASGRITLDKNIIANFSFSPKEDEFEPVDLGSALAEYLYLDPGDALESKNVIIAAFALLDKRLSIDEIRNSGNIHNHVLWKTFLDLRVKD